MYINYLGINALNIVSVAFGDWFDYIRGMEKEIEKGDYVFHVVYYEDMKEVTLNSFIASGDLNSFIASGNFFRLLITFANSLEPNQDRQNVDPDLDP